MREVECVVQVYVVYALDKVRKFYGCARLDPLLLSR